MMFSVRAFLEGALHDRLSKSASFHYGQTLRLLQARLNQFDHTSAISDSTIMVVITLAQAAELTRDFAAVANHVKGLVKIVSLRGGVRALNTHNNMQVKVCRSVSFSVFQLQTCTLGLPRSNTDTVVRADLAYALFCGHQPYLFEKELSWDCFIANRDLIRCIHEPHDADIRAFAETTMDVRLHNVLRDLHAFSCLSNLAYQTTRKLSPEIYNEMMISILYRLTHLSFKSDPLQEAIRNGLLACSSAIFVQRQFMDRPYDQLLNLYNDSLSQLRKATDIDLPVSILLWLTMLSYVIVHEDPSRKDEERAWLDEAITRADIDSWSQAREILKSVVWIDFMHDRRGKEVFESAILRLSKAPRGDV